MKKTNLEVLGWRVLIIQDPVEEETESGLIVVVSEEAKRMEQVAMYTGTIVQIGPTAWTNKQGKLEKWAKVGDHVVYSKFGGKGITDPVTKEDYVIVNDEDVLCLIKETS